MLRRCSYVSMTLLLCHVSAGHRSSPSLPEVSVFLMDHRDIDWPDAACLEVQNNAQELPCWLHHEDRERTSQRKFHCQRWFLSITYIKILWMSILTHLKQCFLNAITEAFCANWDIETRHDTLYWYAETLQNTVQDGRYIHGAVLSFHDDVIKWKHFPRYWPFVRGIHRSPVNSRTKAMQWHGALMFSLICAWMNDWVNNRRAGDLRGYRAHYDVTGHSIFYPQVFAGFIGVLHWYFSCLLQWHNWGRVTYICVINSLAPGRFYLLVQFT